MLTLLEAMTAMFYVAILIARLVALYSERPAGGNTNENANAAAQPQ
jgi:hypothetical protein